MAERCHIECRLCLLSLMLSFTYKQKPFMLSVVMLNVIMLSVMAPQKQQQQQVGMDKIRFCFENLNRFFFFF
jgi:hypothetical protein